MERPQLGRSPRQLQPPGHMGSGGQQRVFVYRQRAQQPASFPFFHCRPRRRYNAFLYNQQRGRRAEPNWAFGAAEALSAIRTPRRRLGTSLFAKPFSDFYAEASEALSLLITGAERSPLGFALRPTAMVPCSCAFIGAEPQEYAFVFGLFALGFVFFHRRMMPKKQRQ